MPAGPRYTREESISRHLSRLLRHGADGREPPLALNLDDGGRMMVSALLGFPTLKRMHVTQDDVMTAAQERDTSNKLRFDLIATLDGPKIRCFQCHT